MGGGRGGGERVIKKTLERIVTLFLIGPSHLLLSSHVEPQSGVQYAEEPEFDSKFQKRKEQ